MFALARELIDETIDQVAAYKPNAAFFEQGGADGLRTLKRIIAHVAGRAFVVLDAKRGDIGNTSRRYARAAFAELGADALTLAPYMGRDSIEPFFTEADELGAAARHSAFVLALTSNPGSADFQMLRMEDGRKLYQHVLERIDLWNREWANGRLGAVVGATRAEGLELIRGQFPALPLLIPGVGAQGGDPAVVSRILSRGSGPALVNVSRGILLGTGTVVDIAAAARRATEFSKQLALDS